MIWICPKCDATFKNVNQSHSCVRIGPAKVLEKASPGLMQLYQRIDDFLMRQEGVYRNPKLSCISYKNPSTFCTIKLKGDHLMLELFLNKKRDEFPVSKIVSASKYRHVHFIPVSEKEDFDDNLRKWLLKSILDNKAKG